MIKISTCLCIMDVIRFNYVRYCLIVLINDYLAFFQKNFKAFGGLLRLLKFLIELIFFFLVDVNLYLLVKIKIYLI